MERVTENIKIENAKILFRNFSGKPGKFNPAGRRSFHVVLPRELGEELLNDGWNVKEFKQTDPDILPEFHLEIRVSYDNIPPKINMVTGRKIVPLDEDTVESLDYAEISNVDLVFRPYNWVVNGKEGITAYVKEMYVTIIEDAFADKYNFDDEEETPF